MERPLPQYRQIKKGDMVRFLKRYVAPHFPEDWVFNNKREWIYRYTDLLYQQVSFERSRSSSKFSISFSVNVIALASDVPGSLNFGRTLTYEWRTLLGFKREHHLRFQWKNDLKALSSEIMTQVKAQVVPKIDEPLTLNAAAAAGEDRFADAPHFLNAASQAVLKGLLGELPVARKYFKRAEQMLHQEFEEVDADSQINSTDADKKKESVKRDINHVGHLRALLDNPVQFRAECLRLSQENLQRWREGGFIE